MFNIEILVILSLILSVITTMASDDNGSVIGTGVDKHIYNLTTKCSISVSASEVEGYHRAVKKATKLVYVHFDVDGTKWDVIKVLDEKSKYLLALGDYETYLIFSLNTLSSGIEHTSVRLHQLSEGCLTKPKDLNRTLMMLVSNNFQTLCKDHQCLENVCLKELAWPVKCAVKDNGEVIIEEVDMNDVFLLIVLLHLIYITIGYLLMTKIGRYVFLFKSNEYHYTQNKDIIILDDHTYLVGKQQVPSGILSSCFSFLVQFIIPFERCLLRSRILTKSVLCMCSSLMCIFLYIHMIKIDSLFMSAPLPPFTFMTSVVHFILQWLPILVIAISRCCLTDSVRSKLFSFSWKRVLPSCYFSEVYFVKNGYVRINKLLGLFYDFLVIFSWIIFSCFCFIMSYLITHYLFVTLIGITTNSVPHFPFVMAGIVYYQKLSTRLSNWYKRFFEIVLDNVTSIAERKVNETIQSSEKNSFIIVKPRSVRMQGRQLQVTGTPIFIDETGIVMFTRSFFHKCVKLNIKHSRHNSLCLLRKYLFKLCCAIVFLTLIALIIKHFGMVGQQSTAHLSLISLASGIIPLALDNYFLEDESLSIDNSDTLFKIHLKELVNSYEEWFTVAPQCNEIIKGNNFTEQNGSELATIQSSSDGQEQTVESSESMTENTEEGDASEKDPLMSMNNRDVIIDIENEDESQEISTELQDDLRYIDIK